MRRLFFILLLSSSAFCEVPPVFVTKNSGVYETTLDKIEYNTQISCEIKNWHGRELILYSGRFRTIRKENVYIATKSFKIDRILFCIVNSAEVK